MPSSTFYNEVLTDHNLYPAHKKPLPGANMTLEGVNPSCGDDIILQLKVENGKIEDGSFVGDGCAISQASATSTRSAGRITSVFGVARLIARCSTG